MEYVDTILQSMLISGIAIPAAMIGFYLSYRRLITFLVPTVVLGLIDHFLVQFLYILDVKQNALVKLGANLGQINWSAVLTKNIIEHVIAFFVIALAVTIITKGVKKVRS